MAFSSYWKEIAIVLAGVFAMFGALSDVKDKRTGKFTIWGRVFFLLTFFSVLGGVYAQWLDSASEEKRNKDAQAIMLSLLQRTEKSVFDLSRLLQPIDKPRVTMFLKPDCSNARFAKFCASVIAEGRREIQRFGPMKGPDLGSSFQVSNVDWSSYPRGGLLGEVFLYFFKDANAAQKFIDDGCLSCDDGGDMYLMVPIFSRQYNAQMKTVSVVYSSRPEGIEFLAASNSVTPKIHNDNILSVVDIPGSTIVASESDKLLTDIAVTAVYIDTPRGQSVRAFELLPVNAMDKFNADDRKTRVFVYHFESALKVIQRPR
ncbi:MAG: hypothetical protein JWM54_2427 [Acidobacteriaceae bacterium]|nr:hypothetical protein [Acidobacteriaceae bacterium]